MDIDAIRLMVVGTKQTTFMGNPAWTVPCGKCTQDFDLAVRLWKEFLCDTPCEKEQQNF